MYANIKFVLFPLDGGWRLGGDVVAYAVDAAHVVDDQIGDLGHEFVGEMGPVGGHGVGGGDGSEGYGALVGAFVAHYAYALHGQEDGSGLPNFVVQIPAAEAVDEDVVGFLKHAHFFGCDVAEDAHCQAGAGEGMALDEVLGHAEGAAYGSHLVFEEEAQGLAEAQIHLLGEAADVVVALDGGAGDGEALDAVGVDGALGEPLDVADLAGFLVEDVDEAFADDLALALGIGHSGELAEEFFGCVDADHIEAEALIVAQHVAVLVLAEHAVIDEDAGEVAADGAVEKHCGHRRVDAAREAEHHLVVAEL